MDAGRSGNHRPAGDQHGDPGGQPHLRQGGHNRNACFFADDDCLFYLECLGQGLRRYGVKLHAYVLMTNHVHPLMPPQEDASISRLMQHVGRRYVLYVNKRYRRSGTLFEGRHEASLVAADDYLVTCYRYIELNPVAAGMVQSPEQYRWSSYHHHAWGKANSLIQDTTSIRSLIATRLCASMSTGNCSRSVERAQSGCSNVNHYDPFCPDPFCPVSP
ncbi:MAG: transposase [Porticoccaceae bacterium]